MKFFEKNIVRMFILFALFWQQCSLSQPTLIIQDQQLAASINQKDSIILDVRNRNAYLKSHIEGAVNLPVSKTFTIGERNDLIAPLSELISKFGRLGISVNSPVVLYDDGSFIDAARVFWILEMIGHNNVAILNSGFNTWRENRFPVSSTPTIPSTTDFVPAVSPSRLATYLQVKMLINKEYQVIIDSRPENEFSGFESKTGRFGHIPSPINIPFDENIDDSRLKLKSIEQLMELYKNIDIKKNVTVYCNKGKQAALSYFVLRILGYKVSAYDGSWFEWGELENFPTESLSKELKTEALLMDTGKKRH